jgi:hypothetical protein
MRSSNPETIMILKNLGVSVKGKSSMDIFDPEALILKSLRFYWTDNSSFFLVLKTLRSRIGHLININRLIKLTQVSPITNDELCLLIAISTILAKEIDNKFLLVKNKLYKKNLMLTNPPLSETDPYLIEEYGLEESLLSFGSRVRKFYDESEKKINSFEQILKINSWLKYRVVIGPNTRSDVLYLFSRNLEEKQSVIARKAMCTRQAVSVIFEGLNKIKITDILDLR